jgi:hypothetical protein
VDGHTLFTENNIITPMRIDLQLNSGMTLKIDSDPKTGITYPTGRIQKGLILLYEGQELCEEAVGFGVPILKRGLQTIFPGELELSPLGGSFSGGMHARFKMNLEEKIAKPGSGTIKTPVLYKVKNFLAGVIRGLPYLRGLLTNSSNVLRSWFALETTYEPTNFSVDLLLTYSVDPGTGQIEVELDGKNQYHSEITEVILMNEQGAHYFDHYLETGGISLEGNEIGCWDQVRAAEASFTDCKHQISFSLPQVEGARLYRGRELIAKRLAWSGFGYSFPPSLDHFRYVIAVKKMS